MLESQLMITTAFQLFNIAIFLLGPTLIIAGVMWLSKLKKTKDSAVKAPAFILVALGIVATLFGVWYWWVI